MSDWRELAKQKKFAEAEELMLAETEKETGYGDEVAIRASFYEDWGDVADTAEAAKKHYHEALGGFRLYASWSTSGGEGTARMMDVNRVLKKLSRYE